MKNFTLALLYIMLTNTLHSQCFSKISSGNYHNIAIKPNGTIYTWGNRSSGLGTLGLGSATGPAILTPTQVGTATNWTDISTGKYNTYAIKSDGTLWGTGYDNHGQVGDGTYGTSHVIYTFTQIGTDTNWKTTSGTTDSTIGLKTNGTLWGWGFNYYGQVGDGTTTERHTPVQIGSDANWKAISSGIFSFNIALKTNGTLWGWGVHGGANCLGQGIGTGNIAYYPSPIQIGADTDWSTMDSGLQHTLALKTNGTLYIFGSGVNGSGGNGLTETGFLTPTQIGTDSNWAQVSAGFNTSYAIKTDGTLWAWGQNDYGQLGDGTLVDKGYPTQIGTDTNWASVQAGYRHCIALKTDGSLWAWGDNSLSQLGISTTASSSIPVQIAVAGCALDNEVFDKATINLYPNPTNNSVVIDNSEAHYQSVAVYNYLGQEVTQQKLTFTNNQIIDLNGFSNGVYLFKLQSENSSETVKVVKK
jgi:alpha-tubulin suppressor-like RCC1 family protein